MKGKFIKLSNDKLHFALIIAIYLGYVSALHGFEKDSDNEYARELIIKMADQTKLKYVYDDADGYVDSEWAYDKADRIAKLIYKKL